MSDNEQNPNQNPEEVHYKPLPPAVRTYFKLKHALKGPTLGRDEQGLTAKRFSKTYFEDTCPYCETTADHEGKKYKYSKVTRRKILINMALMFAVAFATGIGVLNMFVGIAVIFVVGYSTANHAERKMYYTLLCRKCGKQFPMNKEEQDTIRQEEYEKKVAQEASDQEAASAQNQESPINGEDVGENEAED